MGDVGEMKIPDCRTFVRPRKRESSCRAERNDVRHTMKIERGLEQEAGRRPFQN